VKPTDPGHGKSAVPGHTGEGEDLPDVLFNRTGDAGDLYPDGRRLSPQLARSGERGREAGSYQRGDVVAERDRLLEAECNVKEEQNLNIANQR
jgi:hypothetical protein